MSKFGSKEELIKAIENQFSTIQSSAIGIEELELLVEQTRELYERALIIRHKAYEEKIFGEATKIVEEIPEVKEEVSDNFEPIVELIDDESDISDEEIKTEPVFDFSLFDEPTKADEEIENETLEEPSTEIENSNEVEEEVLEAPLEITEEPQSEEVIIEAVEESIPEQNTFSNSTNDIFKVILAVEDNSLGSQFAQEKLDSLTGAFGFNEKFQCIQELFNSSSEDFNQAIDTLDKMSNFDEAKQQLEYYVRLNNWDLESEITAEFVRKVERRFR